MGFLDALNKLTGGGPADDDTPTPVVMSDDDAALLEEILADYNYDVDNWAPIRAEADIDVSYAANDTWTKEDEAARAGRPMLNLDQLSQYRNQVENTVRQNKRGVKVSQAGGGATEKTAELRANRIREIEYQSHAQEAYSQAFSDCLTRGYGFARIVAEYEDEESDNQVFRTKSIPDPNSVIPDSDAQSTSGRDWRRCVFVDTVSIAQFKRDWPTARVQSFDAASVAHLPRWFGKEGRVQIAEVWRLTETPNPRGRGKPTREVCQYVTNGLEFLVKPGMPKKTVWKGKYIPFGACLGRIIYRGTTTGDSQKLILSYIRFARDSAKGFNWTWSTILEKIALPVKASLMGFKGQVDNDILALVERSTKEHVPWIGFNAMTDATGQQVLPLPQYGSREADIQADMAAAEGFQRNIQNSLGHFNATDARMGHTKVTSGVALQELKRSGDLGSYDYLDHYDDFQKFMGEQYDDLLSAYDDTDKEVALRLPDNTTKMQRINHMTGRAPDGSPAYAPDDLRMDQGRHTITISTGPSFDSQREAGKEAAMNLLQNPQAFPIIASDAVKLMDLGPIGDQMAEDLEFLQPPVMQQARQQKAGGEGAPDPRQLQQENSQIKQQLQHAEQTMQQMQGELQGKQAEIASKEKIAGLQIASAERIADVESRRRAETAITVAEINSKAKDAALFMEERGRIGVQIADQAAQASDHLHEHVQADLARQAAAEQAQQAQQHQMGMAAAGAGAAADAQQAGHEQTLAQGQQAADLAPQPTGEE